MKKKKKKKKKRNNAIQAFNGIIMFEKQLRNDTILASNGIIMFQSGNEWMRENANILTPNQQAVRRHTIKKCEKMRSIFE